LLVAAHAGASIPGDNASITAARELSESPAIRCYSGEQRRARATAPSGRESALSVEQPTNDFAASVLLVPQFMAVLVAKAAFATFQGHWGLIPFSLAITLWSSLLRQAYEPNATTLETLRYSVYLLHPVVFYPMYFWISRHDGALTQQPLVLYVVVALVATLAVASLSYLLIERPSNEFARRLSAGLRAPSGSSVARI
jgi:hypothetical protein